MTSRRFDTHDPEGGFQKMRLPENREKRKDNRIRNIASEIGREPDGSRVVVPQEIAPAVARMVQARLTRESKRGQDRVEVPMVVSSAGDVKRLKRVLIKEGKVVDGDKPEELLVHRIRAGVSAGGGVEITEPDNNRMDKWKW